MLPTGAFTLSLLVTGVLSMGSAWLAWLKRDEPGGMPLVVFQVAIAVGLVAYAIDIESTRLSIQRVAIQVVLLSQGVVAATWVYIGIEYSGLDRWANRKTTLLLASEPVLIAVLLVVPFAPLQQLLYTLPESGVSGSLLSDGVTDQPVQVVHLLFVISSTAIGSLLLIQLFVRSRHLYRTQAVAVAVAATAPWALQFVNAVGAELPGDPGTVAFGIAGIALTLGLYRFKTLDPVPTAKETVVEKMGTGVIVLDEEKLVGDFNPAAREFLSTADGEILGVHIGSVFEGWEHLDQEQTDSRDWQELELTVDGRRRFVEIQQSQFTDRFDQEIGTLLVLRDVTERTKREQELARFEQIFESVSDRVYVLDSQNRFLMVNEPFATLVGREPAQLEGEPFESVLAESVTVDDETVIEVTVETPAGEQIPCELTRASISFDRLEAGTVGILRDVSKRKELESSLQETTQQLETIVTASPLAVFSTDPAGAIEVWNPAAAEMFGWTASDLRGEFPPVASGTQRDRFEQLFDRVTDGEQITGEELLLDQQDGGEFEASVSLAPITDESGTVYGTVGIVADITEQKQRQRELERQNERLEQFASVVSHDLRNPLGSAMGYLDLARQTGEQEHFRKVENAHERMERMIEELLTLARAGTELEDTAQVDLAELATDAWETSSTDGATLENEFSTAQYVEGDADLLGNVFENLFRNAVDHNDESVTVRTGSLNGESDGFYVEDTGEGIPDSERDSVFDHGYTTDQNGTGFGLSIVADIAEAHGWEVSVSTGRDGGARFEFETTA